MVNRQGEDFLESEKLDAPFELSGERFHNSLKRRGEGGGMLQDL